MTVEELAGQLGVVIKSTKRSGGRMALCPLHADGTASLSLDVTSDGKPLVWCGAGCDTEPLLSKLRDDRPAEPKKRIAATYDYHAASGDLLFQVCRFEPKGFAQRRPDGKGGWVWGLDGVDPVLYDLPLLLARADDVVFVCEGEKDAVNLQAMDVLATTAPMGAGKWRPSYSEVLRGRQVVILPDNDGPGRQHGQQVARALQGIAASVKVVELPGLPDKGDVSDWLEAGHSAAELLQLVEEAPEWQPIGGIIEFPSAAGDIGAPEPGTRTLGEDSVQVTAATSMGLVQFTFSDMEKAARDLNAEMSMRLLAPGTEAMPYVQRINLLSFSAKDGVRKELDAIYGKEPKWAAVLAQVFATAQEVFLGLDRSISLSQFQPPERMTFLIEGIVPDEGVTTPFGAGTSLKTILSIDWSICISRGLDWLGHRTQQQNVLFIDYETGPKMFGLRTRRLLEGRGLTLADVPNIHYWPGNGIPFPDQVDALRRCIDRHNIGVLFLDHAAVACGGEPEKAETANRFFRAHSKLQRPLVAIAHITGDGERDQAQVQRPFGSIFWSNESRRTWYVRKATQDDGATRAEVGVFRRKVNDGPAPPDFGIEVNFEDPAGPIRISRGNLRDSADLAQSSSRPEDRILAVLAGTMTTSDIAAAANLKTHYAAMVLKEHPDLFECVSAGGGRNHPAEYRRSSQPLLKVVS